MSRLRPRLGASSPAALPRGPLLCDAWTMDGLRGDSELDEDERGRLVGRWPDDLETDAVVRLAQVTGEQVSWQAMADTPPVAQKLAERARPQRLDLEILRHLQHLQHVCHRPRLHLRVEEERLPVARARRWPVRAVADLVSHPGDWEHRTLRSIQPARLLARQIEDEWNLYENRVAVRLIDHLLAYLASRLEELRKIEEALLTGRDHSDEARSSYWRARRLMTLWSDTLTTKTEDDLRRTMRRLESAHRDLQVLMDAPLYREIPRRVTVPLSLKATNILVNDPHYRKVAALWRSWLKFSDKRQETKQERRARRQREAAAWDRFVLHLVVRAFKNMGWAAEDSGKAWKLHHAGSRPVEMAVDPQGVIRLHSNDAALCLLPICADMAAADPSATTALLQRWDAQNGEVVVVHVGAPVDLADPDRATGWSFGGTATLLACSPWGIDSEERMTRLVKGWVRRHTTPAYPIRRSVRDLPSLPAAWKWVRYGGSDLVAFRTPDSREAAAARDWTTKKARELEAEERRAKQAKRAAKLAPRRAVEVLRELVDTAVEELAVLSVCPVCPDGHAVVEARPGRQADGSDATWWAICECGSEWGLRRCPSCGARFHALLPHAGVDLGKAAHAAHPLDWPDRILGHDAWAQPCPQGAADGQFRCPECGACPGIGCPRCRPEHPTPGRLS